MRQGKATRTIGLLALAACVVLASGCRVGAMPKAAELAEIDSVAERQLPKDSPRGGAPAVTREQLRAEVVRFAFSYGIEMQPLLDELKRASADPLPRLRIQNFKRDLTQSWSLILLGEKPEINLLDALVLATLLRLTETPS